MSCVLFFLVKQKTAYEMRISDWSSDVCSSDLRILRNGLADLTGEIAFDQRHRDEHRQPEPERQHDARRRRARPMDVGDGEAQSDPARSRPRFGRSEERRVGKECVSPCNSRWSPFHEKKHIVIKPKKTID